MRHLRKISVESESWLPKFKADLHYADAKTDFMNALWRAWSDFVFQKKNA